MNIRIKVTNKVMSFSVYNKFINSNDINNTNVIDITTMIFKDDYFTSNNELICSFLNTIIIKKNIDSVIIKNNEISDIVLNVIDKISNIKNIYFSDNKKIPYESAYLILKSKYIKYVEAYSIDYFIFDEISTRTDIKIKLMDETVYLNDFMDKNNLGTYSKIFYKKSININKSLSLDDIDFLDMFLKVNNCLNTINLYYYNEDIINLLFNYIDKYKKYDIKIKLFQNDLLDDCLRVIKKFDKFKNKYNIKIVIKYNRDFINKNILKQFNINLAVYIFIIIIILSLVAIFIDKYYENENIETLEYFEQLEEYYQPVVTIEDDVDYYEIYKTSFNNNYNELIKINNDIIGWLNVKNTNINFPILHSTDNEYYLHHTIKKTYNYYGWPFADYRNTFPELSQNTIIYGHSNKLGIVFGTLKNVLQPSWYKNSDNQIIEFDVYGNSYKFQIFSIYTIPVTNDYLITKFTDSEFKEYINREMSRSIYNFNVTVNNDDKILTLSTCYPNTKSRLVVHAKLMK